MKLKRCFNVGRSVDSVWLTAEAGEPSRAEENVNNAYRTVPYVVAAGMFK